MLEVWVLAWGWQFTSGELPDMRKGHAIELPLEFRFIGDPSPGTARSPSLTHVIFNRYELEARCSIQDERRFLDLGVDIPESVLDEPWLGGPPHTSVPLGAGNHDLVSGTVEFFVDAGWWTGSPSQFMTEWIVSEVLVSPTLKAVREDGVDASLPSTWLSESDDDKTDVCSYLVCLKSAVVSDN